MPKVIIEGVENIKTKLSIISGNLSTILPTLVEETARVVEEEGKQIYPPQHIDTGALRGSISSELTKSTPTEAEAQAWAGSERVRRGEGEYRMSLKTGREVTSQATSEYAHKIHNRVPFMVSAMKRGKDYIVKRFIAEIKRIISV